MSLPSKTEISRELKLIYSDPITWLHIIVSLIVLTVTFDIYLGLIVLVGLSLPYLVLEKHHCNPLIGEGGDA